MCEAKPVFDGSLIFWEVGCVCMLFFFPSKEVKISGIKCEIQKEVRWQRED